MAIQRVPDLQPLSHDHHAALVLARRCMQSAGSRAACTPEEAWRQVREAFPWHLEPHFAIEERSLLPALQEVGETELVARVREDHRQMRALAARADAGGDDVVRFGRLLEAHVRFEERELFEVAQQRLSTSALEAVARACRETPRTKP